ncbi:uncharacterized protein LOC116341306 [Contarinia nasturtii]|uniref:uncharacterized protein LOC116341306 n=1 Tax=Contarinia nasturtii TaxID=265458 RepID=UPI0012D39C03|nr:uncharacterized protein LOC116341306 [Contarinia nasturtii]
MAHPSNTLYKPEIMKRCLFIVLIFSVILNQFVTGAPQISQPTNGATPPALGQSASSSFLPSFPGDTGFRQFSDTIAGSVSNISMGLGKITEMLLSDVTKAVGTLFSGWFGAGRVNEANQRSYINQLQPQNQQNNSATASNSPAAQPSQSGSPSGSQTTT